MVARQLYHHPAWTPAELAADLAAARDRLALMHAENLSVAAAFDRSYQDLSAPSSRCSAAWACTRAPTSTPTPPRRWPASAWPRPGGSWRACTTITCSTETARGRYRFHDLIREHARALAAAGPPGERDAAAGRLLDYYLHTARAASQHLSSRIAAGAPALASRRPRTPGSWPAARMPCPG